MIKMFQPPGCICNNIDGLRAALEGKARRLCPIHEADAIAQHEADRRAFEREADLGRVHEIYSTIKSELTAAGQPACSCVEPAAAVARLLKGATIEPCPVHAPTPPESSSVALNDDAELARVIGLPMTRSHNENPPQDAA